MHNNAAGFLDGFMDEVMCRCIGEDDFGQTLANQNNDVPLQDMYNRGLVAPMQGLERNPLHIEGMKRPGVSGLIPSMEEGVAMGASPKPHALVLELPEADDEMKIQSAKRRGLMR